MSPFVETQPVFDDSNALLLRGLKVLVADDNRINQTLLKRWLEAEGVVITQVSDGEAAVRECSRRLFDCVLMDLSMPVMNGLDATHAIRHLDAGGGSETKRLANVPIIGVTAMATPNDRSACLAAGMNGFVTKPVRRDELLTTIVQTVRANLMGGF